MILCIDIGNTSIKMARVARARVLNRQTVSSRAPAREIAAAVARATRGGVRHAVVSSVRPASTAVVRRAVRRELGVDPLVVSARIALPVRVATRHPSRVGTDRICAAAGAVTGRRRHAIIVDIGSAITVDLVLDREFRGGLIMPGPAMMLSSLHHFTAQLPDLRLDSPGAGRIDDTAPAMISGALVGSTGAIRAGVESLRSLAGAPVTVWLTGGGARRLRQRLPAAWRFEPDLVFHGLSAIARLHRA